MKEGTYFVENIQHALDHDVLGLLLDVLAQDLDLAKLREVEIPLFLDSSDHFVRFGQLAVHAFEAFLQFVVLLQTRK